MIDMVSLESEFDVLLAVCARGRREYLSDFKSRELMREINDYFDTKIELPRIRSGKRQRIETMINEEALLLAKYIRTEINEWNPRISGGI